MRLLIWFLLLLNVKNHVYSVRILGIFPFAAPSHYILGSALMKGLAERGHDVTIVSPFTEKNLPKNGTYTEIVLTGFIELGKERQKKMNLFEQESANPFFNAFFINHFLLNVTEDTAKHQDVQKLLNSNQQFDVVIVEQFMNDALKGFAAHFNAPLISFSTVGANAWVNHLVGNPAPPSYIPSPFLNYSSHMSFQERLVSGLYSALEQALHQLYVYPSHAKLAKKYFKNIDNFDDILYNSSVVLLNSHPSTNQAVPHVPNMIEIGGFHVQPPKKLPADLQKFLDEATEGAIYFSLGSNLKSADLPVEKREAFLKTFGKLRQKVLWKWEEDELPGQPPNVKLSKWFPQQDVLAHPNIKLFITHGGLLSTTETIYHGVPVLAIPVFADQKRNANNIVNSGFGLSLAYREITEEALTDKLKQLLSDAKFAQNAKTRSAVFHDRITSPMDTAAYWVEYVARHRGAPHLRVAALDLPLYKYLLLDVIFVVVATLLITLYVSFVILKKVLRRRAPKPQKKLKKH